MAYITNLIFIILMGYTSNIAASVEYQIKRRLQNRTSILIKLLLTLFLLSGCLDLLKVIEDCFYIFGLALENFVKDMKQ